MGTIFRDLSYRYQWLYDAIARLAALSVGGDARLGQLALDFRGNPTDESVCRSIGCGFSQLRSTKFCRGEFHQQ
ncbi:hypothetical protein [Microcoleus sp. S13_B4]|uniref:hypothetical protein n=1 Tax=Microcoleus sp. S13_B4 TaxID=3055408 RepID=UPI00403F581F